MIKLVYGSKNKIVKLDKPEFNCLQAVIKQSFPDVPFDYTLSYLDSDKDQISLGSDEDLLILLHSNAKVHKIFVKQSLSQVIEITDRIEPSFQIYDSSLKKVQVQPYHFQIKGGFEKLENKVPETILSQNIVDEKKSIQIEIPIYHSTEDKKEKQPENIEIKEEVKQDVLPQNPKMQVSEQIKEQLLAQKQHEDNEQNEEGQKIENNKSFILSAADTIKVQIDETVLNEKVEELVKKALQKKIEQQRKEFERKLIQKEQELRIIEEKKRLLQKQEELRLIQKKEQERRRQEQKILAEKRQQQRRLMERKEQQRKIMERKQQQRRLLERNRQEERKLIEKKVVKVQNKQVIDVDEPKSRMKIFEEKRPIEKKPILEGELIYHGVICSNCKDQYGIFGCRYQCIFCEGFNLCQSCELFINHEHPLLKVKRPEQTFTKDLIIEKFRNEINVKILPPGHYVPSISKEEANKYIETTKELMNDSMVRAQRMINDMFLKMQMSHKNPYELHQINRPVQTLREKMDHLISLFAIDGKQAKYLCQIYRDASKEQLADIYIRKKTHKL